MKNKNIYKLFACNDKEELYQKLITNSDDVRDLSDFINYTKGDIALQNEQLTSSDDVFDYLEALDKPDKETIFLIGANTRLQPVITTSMKVSDTNGFKNVTSDLVQAGASNCFLFYNSGIEKEHIDNARQNMNLLGVFVQDEVKYDHDKKIIESFLDGSSRQQTDKIKNVKKEISNKISEYKTTEKFIELMNYYASKSLIGCDVNKDNAKIKEIIKLGYQHEVREVFGCVLYDGNNKVINSKVLFEGGMSAALVDMRVLYKYVLSRENTKGMFVYHNHPSGSTSPSNEDINFTKRIARLSDKLNIEFKDSIIVAKGGVFSFRENTKVIEHATWKGVNLASEPQSNYKATNQNEFKTQKENIMENTQEATQVARATDVANEASVNAQGDNRNDGNQAQSINTVNVVKIVGDKMSDLLKKPMYDEKGRASLPFLPNKEGFCETTPVMSATNGFRFDGIQQVTAKMYLHERGQDGDNILTFVQAAKAGTAIKKGEKGFYMPGWDYKNGKLTTSRFFAESQVANKEKLPYIPTKDTKPQNQIQKDNWERADQSDPVVYMTEYLRAVQDNRAFKPSFEVAEKFKNNLMLAIQERPVELFKICNEASKTLWQEKQASKELNKQTEKTQEKTMTRQAVDMSR